MASLLFDTLSKREKELSDEVAARLHGLRASGYQKMDEALLHERAERLVKAFLGSIEGKPAAFVDYVGGIVEERIAEGIVLREIQTALQILEEKSWRLIVQDVGQGDQVASLGQVTGIVGLAKDQLAQIYLEALRKAESRATTLQRRVDELAKGTDPGPIGEEDL